MTRSYADLIAAFGAALGQPDLAADEHGTCAFTVDDDATVFIQQRDDDTVLVFAEVGRLPNDAAARELLAANLFGQGAAGGNIGLAPDTGLVIMSRQEPLRGLDHTELATILEVFLDLLGHWRAALPNLGAAEASAEVDGAVGVRV